MQLSAEEILYYFAKEKSVFAMKKQNCVMLEMFVGVLLIFKFYQIKRTVVRSRGIFWINIHGVKYIRYISSVINTFLNKLQRWTLEKLSVQGRKENQLRRETEGYITSEWGHGVKGKCQCWHIALEKCKQWMPGMIYGTYVWSASCIWFMDWTWAQARWQKIDMHRMLTFLHSV